MNLTPFSDEATPGSQPLNTVNVVPDTAGVTNSGRSEINKICEKRGQVHLSNE